MMNRYVLMVIFLCQGLVASAQKPVVFWASQPVLPGEIVYVQGDGLDANAQIEICVAEKDTLELEKEYTNSKKLNWEKVKAIQAVGSSLKFQLPLSPVQHSYACRIKNGTDISDVFHLNKANVWWMQGSDGEYKTKAGSWLRLLGVCLAMNGDSKVYLKNVDNELLELKKINADCWSSLQNIPDNIEPGEYDVLVYNGLGKTSMLSNAGRVEIQKSVSWKKDIFNVIDYRKKGEDIEYAIQAAIKASSENGGGIIYFEPGRYKISTTINMPEYVTLKGAGRDLVTLYWPDMPDPLLALIKGKKNFAVEDMTIKAGNHADGIQVEGAHKPGCGHVHIRRVNMRLDRLSPVTRRNVKDWQKKYESRLWTDRYAAIRLGGENVEVSDCDIMTRNALMNVAAIYLERVKGAVITGNKIDSSFRTGFYIAGSRNIIIENNDFTGGTFIGTHHSNKTLNMYCNNIYFASNKQKYALMNDSEIVTLDSHGPAGMYLGKVASCDGSKLTLASDPDREGWFRWDGSYQESDKGAGVYILDGKGAGQYRFLTHGDGRIVTLDRPWQIDPDETSIISIAKYHGHFIFADNEFRDGGNIQLWGGNLESVVAGNKFYRTGVLLSKSGCIYGGHMPDWYSQFIKNESFQAGDIGSNTYEYSDKGLKYSSYKGPIARATIHRGNIHHTGGIYLSGGIDGAVVENCKAKKFPVGFSGTKKPVNVLTQDNEKIK